MSERVDGWYWVKLEDSDGWIPWEWRSSSRSTQGGWFNSETPVEVGPRIPTPDEPWRCVPKEPTEEMADSVMWATHSNTAACIWVDMLAAAPTPGESRYDDTKG